MTGIYPKKSLWQEVRLAFVTIILRVLLWVAPFDTKEGFQLLLAISTWANLIYPNPESWVSLIFKKEE